MKNIQQRGFLYDSWCRIYYVMCSAQHDQSANENMEILRCDG